LLRPAKSVDIPGHAAQRSAAVGLRSLALPQIKRALVIGIGQ
jgi:hypothetical protein